MVVLVDADDGYALSHIRARQPILVANAGSSSRKGLVMVMPSEPPLHSGILILLIYAGTLGSIYGRAYS